MSTTAIVFTVCGVWFAMMIIYLISIAISEGLECKKELKKWGYK